MELPGEMDEVSIDMFRLLSGHDDVSILCARPVPGVGTTRAGFVLQFVHLCRNCRWEFLRVKMLGVLGGLWLR